jgi:nucleoid-associated protein
MKVIKAIAHQLYKTPKTVGATINPSKVELTPSAELSEMVSELLDTFNTKTAQRTGVFEVAGEQYPFVPGLKNYLGGKLTFVTFTTLALKQLAFLMKDVHPAGGGYIFFVHYQVAAGDFFVVAKLNDAKGKVFNKARTKVIKNFHLSLDRLHHVGRVNLGGWKANANKYLTFVNARENGKSSDYFVKFLGCSTATKPRVETGKLVAIVEAFCASQNMSQAQEVAFKQDVFNHAKALPKGQPVSLSTLANAVLPDDPGKLIEFINASDDAPTDDFCVDVSTLKSLIGYRVNVPGLKMWMTSEFKQAHKVRFNENNELVISDAALLRDDLE